MNHLWKMLYWGENTCQNSTDWSKNIKLSSLKDYEKLPINDILHV